ncbi:MAG: uroporphyrinogen-III synthase [Deltaproteobacteria bacterium]|nr:uroporphyrinogen-III synthase [Deltaproteobacteria bacterium]
MTAGKVTFVGAGCGDPRLLTLRGAEALAAADFVLFDQDVHPDVLARLREGTPRHPVTSAMGPERVGSILAEEARQGRRAVRLAWADPLLFGEGDAEASAVSRLGVEVEVVPGIGPFIAVGAFAGIPLTRSNDASPSLAIVSVTKGHETLHDWQKLATATDMLAILCDAETVAETARSLVFYGRAPGERATVIEGVSLPTQRVVQATLGQVPLLPKWRTARVVLVVGERASPVDALRWLEKKSLFGKRVLVTRAREQAGSAAMLLRERGADPVVMPTIEIHPPSDPSAMIDAVEALHERYDWVVLTSANGVERLWAEIQRQGKDARAFGRARIAAIGPGTAAALERCGLRADLVPKEHRGEALAAEILAAMPDPKVRVLLARARVARDVVPDTLRAAGATVDVVPVYETRSPPRALLEGLSALLEGNEIDAVIFTSSSTAEHLCDALGERAAELLAHTCVASIGPITSATAERRGLRVDVTSDTYTVAGLVDALEGHFAKSSSKP